MLHSDATRAYTCRLPCGRAAARDSHSLSLYCRPDRADNAIEACYVYLQEQKADGAFLAGDLARANDAGPMVRAMARAFSDR